MEDSATTPGGPPPVAPKPPLEPEGERLPRLLRIWLIALTVLAVAALALGAYSLSDGDDEPPTDPRVTDLRAQVTVLESELKPRVADLEQQTGGAPTAEDLERLRKQVTAINKRVSELDKELQEGDEAASPEDLETRIDDLEQRIEDLEADAETR